MSKTDKVIKPDIGILASWDPVALDQASVDLVLESAKEDILRTANNVDWEVQLRHSQDIGLGTREYELIEIDD